jgi:hypothetical protein
MTSGCLPNTRARFPPRRSHLPPFGTHQPATQAIRATMRLRRDQLSRAAKTIGEIERDRLAPGDGVPLAQHAARWIYRRSKEPAGGISDSHTLACDAADSAHLILRPLGRRARQAFGPRAPWGPDFGGADSAVRGRPTSSPQPTSLRGSCSRSAHPCHLSLPQRPSACRRRDPRTELQAMTETRSSSDSISSPSR